MSRRRIIFIVLGLTALAAAGLAAWLAWPRDETTRASVGDAVQSFRSEDSGASHRPGEPLYGVYRYATVGGEEADAIFSAGHDYGGISTITLSEGRCGTLERWQVFEGRWTEAEACPGEHGPELVSAAEFHEFFGVEQEDAFRCHGAASFSPAELRGRSNLDSSCRSEDSSVESSSHVVRREAIAVAGRRYPSLLIVSRNRLSGATSGVSIRQDWRRLSDGLLLRRAVTSGGETDAAGGTTYTEHYRLRLLDVNPRR